MDTTDLQNKVAALEARMALLEADKLAVSMSVNSDTNLYRSLLRTLRGRVNLGIGTSSPSVDTMLDVVSTNLAVRFPCMTTAQRDAITVSATSEGFLIFNTSTHVFNFYNGTAWGAI